MSKLRHLVFIFSLSGCTWLSGKVTRSEVPYCDLHAADLPFAGGAGTEQSPYLLCSVPQFKNVSTSLSAQFRLMTNLDLSQTGTDWDPIGSTGDPFKGVFDGNGFSISNLRNTGASAQYAGIFGVIESATVKNLTVSGATLQPSIASSYVGVIAGRSQRSNTLINLTLRNSTVGGVASGASGGVIGEARVENGSITLQNVTVVGLSLSRAGGGLVGRIYDSTGVSPYTHSISNASVSNATMVGACTGCSQLGGLVGFSNAGFSVNGATITNIAASNAAFIGGVVGAVVASTVSFSVSSVTIQGTLNGGSSSGGVAGTASVNTLSISSLRYSGTVGSSSTGKSGGLFGDVTTQIGGVISESSVSAQVISSLAAGGFYGEANNGSSVLALRKSSFDGSVTSAAGGVASGVTTYNAGPIEISEVAVRANVSGGDNGAGFVWMMDWVSISNSYFSGTISATNEVGGIGDSSAASTSISSVLVIATLTAPARDAFFRNGSSLCPAPSCHYDSTLSGAITEAGGGNFANIAGQTTATLQGGGVLTGLALSTWSYSAGRYPKLAWEP